MAFNLADRVKETTTTTGTGAVALAGAVSGFRSFSAGIGVGDTTWYTIVNDTGSEFECGEGILTGASTLSRTTVFASSNTNALVNFSAGTKDVFITVPADKLEALNGTPSRFPNGERAISASASVTSADHGKQIVITAPAGATIALTFDATFTTGMYVGIERQDGVYADVSVVPAGGQMIDGLASIKIYQESHEIVHNGSNLRTQGRPRIVPIGSAALTGQTLTNFTVNEGFTDPEVRQVETKFSNLTMSSSTTVQVRPIKGGAVKTATVVTQDMLNTATTTVSSTSTNAASAGATLNLTATLGPIAGTIRCPDTLATVAAQARFETEAVQIGATRRGFFYEATAASLEGFQLFPTAGTIASITRSSVATRT